MLSPLVSAGSGAGGGGGLEGWRVVGFNISKFSLGFGNEPVSERVHMVHVIGSVVDLF